MDSRYRRLFFSEKTPFVAAAVAVAANIAYLAAGLPSGNAGVYEFFDFAVRLLVLSLLLFAYRKHRLMLLQASCMALLFCMLYTQASYALGTLLAVEAEEYISLGMSGSLFLADELMILVIEFVITANYLIMHAEEKVPYVRTAVNQICIAVLLALLALQIFVNAGLPFGRQFVITFAFSRLSGIATLVCVACGELILAIDRGEP